MKAKFKGRLCQHIFNSIPLLHRCTKCLCYLIAGSEDLSALKHITSRRSMKQHKGQKYNNTRRLWAKQSKAGQANTNMQKRRLLHCLELCLKDPFPWPAAPAQPLWQCLAALLSSDSSCKSKGASEEKHKLAHGNKSLSQPPEIRGCSINCKFEQGACLYSGHAHVLSLRAEVHLGKRLFHELGQHHPALLAPATAT